MPKKSCQRWIVGVDQDLRPNRDILSSLLKAQGGKISWFLRARSQNEFLLAQSLGLNRYGLAAAMALLRASPIVNPVGRNAWPTGPRRDGLCQQLNFDSI